MLRSSLRSAVANELDRDIVVSEFELQSFYYTHFRNNKLQNSFIHHLWVKKYF